MISKEQVLNKRWLFIDLDDTLIETVSGNTFPAGIWDMKFKEDCLDAIKAMKPEGVLLYGNQYISLTGRALDDASWGLSVLNGPLYDDYGFFQEFNPQI